MPLGGALSAVAVVVGAGEPESEAAAASETVAELEPESALELDLLQPLMATHATPTAIHKVFISPLLSSEVS
jgi:hypothetical protein